MRRVFFVLGCLLLALQCAFAQSVFVLDKNGQLKTYNQRTIFFNNPFTITYSEPTSTDNSISFSFDISSSRSDVKSFDQTPIVGVCFTYVYKDPTIGDGYKELTQTYTDLTKQTFTCELKGLNTGSYYFIRAFICIGDDVFYGPRIQKATTGSGSSPDTLNGHAIVDLGLTSGKLWASENVSAGVAGDYGRYFAWGETAFKSSYAWSNYKYGSSSPLSKYNSNDSKYQLDAEDDVATVLWGEKWKTPTTTDWQELMDECTWTWSSRTTSDGWTCYGYTVTGPNKKSIFLPAAGSYDTAAKNIGSNCCYWTSIRQEGLEASYFWSDNTATNKNIYPQYRFIGMPIRPVADKQ